MKRKLTKTLALLAIMIAPLHTSAKVTLSPLWGDNMVVQRNHEVIFWGSSDKKRGSVEITPSWSDKSYTAAIGKGGEWRVIIPTPDAGVGYNITFDDGDKLTLNNVLLGDVWLLMGQSNMSLKVRGSAGQPVNESARTISQARSDRNIRLLTIDNIASQTPQESYPPHEWHLNNPESVSEFSAAGYFFGCDIESALQIPVGLISVNWGASIIEAWMSPEWLSKLKEYDLSHLSEKSIRKLPNRFPCYLYNGMIAPLKDISVTGALWYQGEGNRFNPQKYLALFPAFVEGLRSHMNSGEFPFYYAQIAPYSINNDYLWVVMREAMSQLMALTPRTGMVTLTDIGEQNRIHPRYKREVGERFALWALGDHYGLKGFDYRAPEYREVKFIPATGKQPAKLGIYFDYAPNGLCFGDRNWESTNFEIAGEDRVFYPAQAKVIASTAVLPTKDSGPMIEVWSKEVEHPVAVRYAFKNFVIGDLYNTFGIPVSSFRSDNWEIE